MVLQIISWFLEKKPFQILLMCKVLLSVTHDAEIFQFLEERKESSGLNGWKRLSLTEDHHPTSSLGLFLGERYPFPPPDPSPRTFYAIYQVLGTF